ncbi:uncharacterized protein LOC109534013 [Dendroctonus ponderosae]|uniref:Uncharacterized protein n=1 Tax=Dendroctonus ponderosae TaxID=77166 RepID=A0AAR5P1T9_DENPD|nr:uncharacterized protein LOC109534013 [Dendroctonus ponderosae]KAH1014116.1 hypothetical protein HUJ04_003010 [Dendroctonus ponderosae]KAH1024002.1 hypothetical protein HUJ05_003570 [Dendroctonus ponderosae]
MSFFIQKSCIIFTLFYLTIFIPELAYTADECDKIRTSGTGTVLFNPTDVYKTCWSQEEIAILTARVILEDVIPDPKLISVQCNNDIQDLVGYFKALIDTIRFKTKARKRHILLLALTDLLGGFLHHALLPMARKAYYSGAIDYIYMEKLIQLYEELKWFLRTNGQGWAKPMTITKGVKVPTIEMEMLNSVSKNNESCCHKLMYYEREPLKSRKRSVTLEKGIYFPLPFFDAKSRPTAIALPLKHFALRNIESKRAAFVIMKYFISAERCLKEKQAKTDQIQKFQNNLYTWIDKEVVPKLKDDKFYSAFGGVLRVHNTLRTLGAKLGSKMCNTDEVEEDAGAIPGVACSSKRNKLLLIAMLVIIVAWFVIGTCFICYRMKNNRLANQRGEDEGKRTDSSSSFTSSRWSSMISKSSSKTDKGPLCKCCESTISERSTPGLSSTSEYDSEKLRKKERRNPKAFRASHQKDTQSSPCVCPTNDSPAVIDANHSMKVLPSIAEMSEQSLQKEKNGSFRKISFADESGISSSDGGIKVCAPPWAQTKNTSPCPILSGKAALYSTSRSTTAKSQAVMESSKMPLVNPTVEDLGMQPESNEFKQSHGYRLGKSSSTQFNASGNISNEIRVSKQYGPSYTSKMDKTANHISPSIVDNPPLKHNAAETTNDYTTSNQSTVFENSPSNPITVTSGTGEEYNEEEKPTGNDNNNSNEDPRAKEKRNTLYDYRAACHSSMSGSYDLFHKPDHNKPYIFGYDFQTSSSSEVSDDDDSKY